MRQFATLGSDLTTYPFPTICTRCNKKVLRLVSAPSNSPSAVVTLSAAQVAQFSDPSERGAIEATQHFRLFCTRSRGRYCLAELGEIGKLASQQFSNEIQQLEAVLGILCRTNCIAKLQRIGMDQFHIDV